MGARPAQTISSVSPGSCGSAIPHPAWVPVASLSLTGYTGLCWSLFLHFSQGLIFVGADFLQH